MRSVEYTTTVERWATERERAGTPKFVRWYCTCGRLGPAIKILTTGSRSTAERGGRIHLARCHKVAP